MSASRAASVPAASKLLIVAGALYIVNVFTPWQRICFPDVGCATSSGVSGIGFLNLLLAMGLMAWELLPLVGVEVGGQRALVSAALAGSVLLFTLLKILVDSDHLYLFGWVGLALALVIGYGGWLRWQEYRTGDVGPGGPGSDGSSGAPTSGP